MEGIIIKNQSNDYTVRTSNGLYVSKPRGKFRNDKITPLVGYSVIIDDINNIVNSIFSPYKKRPYTQLFSECMVF